MKNKQVAISLEPWLNHKLEGLSVKSGRSVSSIGAEAIAFYLGAVERDPGVLAVQHVITEPHKRSGRQKPKTSIFTGLNTADSIKRIQAS